MQLFMCLMNVVFKTFVDSFVLIFIDYILVYSKSEEKHPDHLRIILGAIGVSKIVCKISMFDFFLNYIKLFEHVV